jgi:hypothetical protein
LSMRWAYLSNWRPSSLQEQGRKSTINPTGQLNKPWRTFSITRTGQQGTPPLRRMRRRSACSRQDFARRPTVYVWRVSTWSASKRMSFLHSYTCVYVLCGNVVLTDSQCGMEWSFLILRILVLHCVLSLTYLFALGRACIASVYSR